MHPLLKKILDPPLSDHLIRPSPDLTPLSRENEENSLRSFFPLIVIKVLTDNFVTFRKCQFAANWNCIIVCILGHSCNLAEPQATLRVNILLSLLSLSLSFSLSLVSLSLLFFLLFYFVNSDEVSTRLMQLVIFSCTYFKSSKFDTIIHQTLFLSRSDARS